MVAWAPKARDLGFTAAKLEATFDGPYAHKGLHGPDEWIVEVVRAVREAAGPQMTLMVDVQYAFDDVERALRAAEAIAPYDVFFLETPLWVDDLDGYAELTAALARADRAGRVADRRTSSSRRCSTGAASTSRSPTSDASGD